MVRRDNFVHGYAVEPAKRSFKLRYPSGRLFEVAHLRIKGALETRAGGAALDVSLQTLVIDEVGTHAQHRRHHEVARGEARAVQMGLIPQRVGEKRKS
jgi:hypothetical protein